MQLGATVADMVTGGVFMLSKRKSDKKTDQGFFFFDFQSLCISVSIGAIIPSSACFNSSFL